MKGETVDRRSGEGGTGFSMGVGGASILVVFVILALVALSALSLASAGAEKRLSDQAAAVTVDYYTADSQGERLLAQLDEELCRLWEESREASQPEQYYRQSLTEQLPLLSGAQVTLETDDEGKETLLIDWNLSVDDRRTLEIEVDASSRLTGKDGPLKRQCWKLVVSPIEGDEDTMQIIGG